MNTLAYCYLHVAVLACVLHKNDEAEDFSRRAVQLSDEHGMLQWKALAMFALASALSRSGKLEEADELMEEARTIAVATNSYVFMAFFLAHHVGNLAALGNVERATETRHEVIAIMRERSESWAHAEIFRMLAEAERLGPGGDAAAENDYRQALAIAREQKAKFWELRAATGLAALMRDQGKHGEARDLLAPVYGWFTEDFETPDLIEAKALLDALG